VNRGVAADINEQNAFFKERLILLQVANLLIVENLWEEPEDFLPAGSDCESSCMRNAERREC
jgi:hypothetical protein